MTPPVPVASIGAACSNVPADRGIEERMSQTPDPHVEALFRFAADLEALALLAGRPKLRTPRWHEQVRERGAAIAADATTLRAGLPEGFDSLAPALDRVVRSTETYLGELAIPDTPRKRLKALAGPLSLGYEELRRELKRFPESGSFLRSPRLERMKPVNYRRNLFHVAMGLGAAGLYEFFLTRGQAILVLSIVLGIAVSFEISRRFIPAWNRILLRHVFRDVARPWEHRRPNSASWYTLALLIITVLTPKLAAEIGVLVLAFGDPAASVAGRKWGKRKLYRRKSWVGTLAFAGVAALLTGGLALAKGAPLGPLVLVGMALTVAVSAAIAELFSDTVDDNATVPITAACVAALWLPS